MNIEFIWHSTLSCSDELKVKVENNFKNQLLRCEIPKDCLKGEVKVFFENTGALNQILNGQIVCGPNEIYAFSSSRDGNNIHIKN
jgi:hypothetical protein